VTLRLTISVLLPTSSSMLSVETVAAIITAISVIVLCVAIFAYSFWIDVRREKKALERAAKERALKAIRRMRIARTK
jgi:hypothetical protein